MILKPQSYFLLISLIFCLVCIGDVSAYYLNLEVPRQVQAGDLINVTGSTNIPPDTVTITFSAGSNVPVEYGSFSIVFDERGDKTFNTSFETTGLLKGQYKIEAKGENVHTFSAGSRSIRIVDIVDRSDELILSSPDVQQFDDKLDVDGYIRNFKENAVQLDLFLDDAHLFGPEFIPVDRHGDFSYEVPIYAAGEYFVRFSDYKGLIGTYPILVKERTVQTTETVKPVSTSTPLPLLTRDTTSPLIDSENTKEVSAVVSRDAPGYFLVIAGAPDVAVFTSEGADWVMEYLTDDRTEPWKVNDRGRDGREEILLEVNPDDRIYVKVYPYSFTAIDDLILYGTNVAEISSSWIAEEKFGSGSATPQTPSSIFILVAALGIPVCLILRRKR
ncbi:MAG: hypothetical protein JXA44_12145 [Methanospirillaceae archaeon]|nr:hypothetical protein [Methanospirillaceae archaeon]